MVALYQSSLTNVLPDALRPRNNFAAPSPPTNADDSSAGYSAGSEWLNTVTGSMWYCVSAAVGAAVWAPVEIFTGFVVGRYYCTPTVQGVATAAIPAKDTMYAHAFEVRRRIRVDRLIYRHVAAGTASAVKLAFYAMDMSSFRPGARLTSANPAGQATTGAAADITQTEDLTIPPGMYWAVSLHDFSVAPTASCVNQTNVSGGALYGGTTALTTFGGSSSQVTGYSKAQAYADGFPATFGAGSEVAGNGVPCLCIRPAAF